MFLPVLEGHFFPATVSIKLHYYCFFSGNFQEIYTHFQDTILNFGQDSRPSNPSLIVINIGEADWI